ncbi:MAG: enoyl-CoA hydratase/isomerase family protein [Chloroflexi bacterium]|nr:enoyl-CoA hydratase/isomerase family protein [Chloroflexota bacterium]
MPGTVLLETEGHLAIVTLNRAQALNTISSELASDLVEVCQRVQQDDDLWLVLVRSSSERAFCVGADLKERRDMDLARWRRHRELLGQAFEALAGLDKPAIAVVDGLALGGGCELALLCDFILASERAEFGLPEVKLGIIPGGGGTQSLPRRVGVAMASELIFTGRRVGAQEALRIGLANRVVPPDQLWETALGVAAEILQNGPLAVRQARKAIRHGADLAFAAGWALETEAYNVCLLSEDRAEGLAAFNEKRKPRFKNR